jgi:hypothetical protein
MTYEQHISAARHARENELKSIVNKYKPKTYEELRQIQQNLMKRKDDEK